MKKNNIIMVPIVYLFAFLAIVDCVFGSCIPNGISTPGMTVPEGDITVEYGIPLNIYCILDTDYEDNIKHKYNSSHMYFTHQDVRVDQENIIVVNDTTIHLHIPRPARSESFYYCKLDTEKVVCLNHVIVGTKPTVVDNFDCVSLNWENLTCTWKPQNNFVKTQFYLSFSLPRRNGRMLNYQCPNMIIDRDTGQYSCFWSMDTVPPYRQSYRTYNFNLTAVNKFGSLHQEFIFNHYAHLKPDSPINLSVDLKTSHGCQLYWSLPKPMYFFPGKILHKIIYRSDLDDAWYTVNTSSLPTIAVKYKYSFNLTNLPYAYRSYNIGVAIRTEQDTKENFWSDDATITCRTLAKPPERSPLVDIGSFEVATNFSHRNVALFWEQLQVYEENGDNFTYKVEVQLIDGMKLNHLTKYSTKSYVVFESLPLYSIQFTISSSNVEGDSPNKTKLILPPQNELMNEATDFTKIALGNGAYELTWKPPLGNSSLLHSYTIFWCEKSRDGPFQCDGRLQWERIPPNLTTKKYTMPEEKIYEFAISANGYETSSGMVWASSCHSKNTFG